MTLWPAELDIRSPEWLVLAGTHPEDMCQATVSIWVGCQKPRHIAEGLPLQAYPVPGSPGLRSTLIKQNHGALVHIGKGNKTQAGERERI